MSAPSDTAAGTYVFRMPSLGADMDAGTLLQWLIAPGDRVHRGDIVAVVETEKADIEVEIFASGVVSELLVGVGTRVPVGTPLARLRTEEVPGEPAGVPGEPAGVPGEPAGVPGEPAEVPGEPAGVPGEPVEVPREPVVEVPGEPVEVPGEPVEVPGEPVEVPGEPAETEEVPGEPAEVPGEPAGVPGESVEVPREPVEVPREPVEVPREPVEVPREPVEVPGEHPAEPVVPGEHPAGRFLASPAARARAAALGLDLHYVTGTGPSGAVVLRDVERRARQPEPPPHRLHVHPVARKMAAELGIDLTQVTGTGLGHAVTKADVERAATDRRADATRQAPATPATRAPRGLRQALAAAMSRSNREIPHYYLGEEIDLERALAWLARTNAERPVTERLLPAALLLKAVALAAREVPEMNGFWLDGAFRPAAQVHLGVAVSRRSGEVVVPALHDADTLTLDQLMAALRDLVQRARAGSLRSSEVTDATLTVTNLGDLGATSVFGVIYPPQTALVGFGRITARPWVEDGKVVARQAVTATLAADHRASDGYRGGRFLARIGELLADPDRLAGS